MPGCFDEDAYRPYKEEVLYAINKIFRRLLGNLLLDFDNPKFRSVRKENSLVLQSINGLPKKIVDELFSAIGFSDAGSTYKFTGFKEQLKTADDLFCEIEQTFLPPKATVQELKPLSRGAQILKAPALPSHLPNEYENTTTNSPFIKEDFDEAAPLMETVRKTLLRTGRVRNCFFEAKHFSVRRMLHGRVYACSEKCDNSYLEAHWHLTGAKNMVYAHVAHLSADGSKLMHLGHEFGYQYSTIPGMANFGKTVNFSIKLINPDGHLTSIEHPNKVVTSCIYCGENLQKIFFC